MNIVFFSMDNSENQQLQELVAGKLRQFHGRDKTLCEAQVNFYRQDAQPDASKVCEIHLTRQGSPHLIRKSASSYEAAATAAILDLEKTIDQAPNLIPS